MKNRYFLIVVFFVGLSNAQIGVNNFDPKVTFHIKRHANPQVFDGLLAPALEGDFLKSKIYGTDQDGAIVYVNKVPSSLDNQLIDVKTTGYYIFSNLRNKWMNLQSGISTGTYWLDQNTNVVANPQSKNIYYLNDIVNIHNDFPIYNPDLPDYVSAGSSIGGFEFLNDNADEIGGSRFYINKDEGFGLRITAKPLATNFDNSDGGATFLHKIQVNEDNIAQNPLMPSQDLYLRSEVTKSGTGIYMDSDITRNKEGFGFFNAYGFSYNSATSGNNSLLAIDNNGVKIGKIKSKNGIISDYNNFHPKNNNYVADSYYFPQELPKEHEVLVYDNTLPSGNNVSTVVTKWQKLIVVENNINTAVPFQQDNSMSEKGLVLASQGQDSGIILKSPNGTDFFITVNEDGSLRSRRIQE